MVMDREGLPSVVFADRIGIKQSTLSHILNGRNNPSLDVVMKVCQCYEDVTLEWLLYGKGELPSVKDVSIPSNVIPSLFGNEESEMPLLAYPEIRKEAVESASNSPKGESVVQAIKYVERPQRKITEIRIFFDDNTYETFRGEN